MKIERAAISGIDVSGRLRPINEASVAATPDLTCGLDVGAATTVSEPDDRPIHFTKFREFDSAAFHASESEDVVT